MTFPNFPSHDYRTSDITLSRKDYISLSLFILVWIAGVCAFAYHIGYTNGHGDWDASMVLPACEEDEYLAVAGDYKGPGNNKPSDYECVHIDASINAMIEETIKQTLLQLGLVSELDKNDDN